uniref:Protein kinase domain-containing protein n=1 Tax=Salix viminalis TaxID=40686 RepID=A0A6N2L7I1_SALVM
MSQEYAIVKLFSVKSDVFSCGVLILEMVSGKRNRGFYHPEHGLNLLGHVRRPIELMDALMEKPADTSELLRCIMSDSENPALPLPNRPGFYTERYSTETDSSLTGTFRN